tara:strand:+ start:804 stop:1574 length:771 start_codon:yes stop_codon:yes gene_type:complete
MANNQGDARINTILENVCPDKKEWKFTKEPFGQCLNKTQRNCLCSHRCNNLLSYQFEDFYILIGKCCAKKYFTFNAQARNEIAIHQHRPTRYCIICEKLISGGIHMFEDTHYTCHIRTVLLPKAKDALENLDLRSSKIAIHSRILEYKISILEGLILRSKNKKFKYNNQATVNAPCEKAKLRKMTNQDLMDINEVLDNINTDTDREKILNIEITTSQGVWSLKYILGNQKRLEVVCTDWANGFYDEHTKENIRLLF